MATNAISRHQSGTPSKGRVSAKIDDFGTDGVFEFDLDTISIQVVRGSLGSLSPEEFCYRIWRQYMDVRLSEKKLRQIWGERK